jgi:hypothetical protein
MHAKHRLLAVIVSENVVPFDYSEPMSFWYVIVCWFFQPCVTEGDKLCEGTGSKGDCGAEIRMLASL